MGETLKPIVVFSGVNLIEGGPLSIFKDAINAFLTKKIEHYSLTVIVHNKELFKEFDYRGINFIERQTIKNSYLRRFWFEYVECYFLSKKLAPYLWFALHDITPKVKSVKQAVYCHNPGPFYKASLKEAKADRTFFFFTLFYKFIYKINIKSNNFVVVQQDWIRKYFIKKFNVKNVIVAHPNIPSEAALTTEKPPHRKNFTFFYPAFPRVFKNFETLLKAANLLSASRSDFNVILTIDGTENGYSHELVKKYSNLSNVLFIGAQIRNEILNWYVSVDCLIFPSKLETWGLPISEFKFFKKPMIVADELYARETVGDYEKAAFFTTENANELASYMNATIDGEIQFKKNEYSEPAQPYSKNWSELLDILLP
jgi:glycosyltransferase involved in cell wall biosynthesis